MAKRRMAADSANEPETGSSRKRMERAAPIKGENPNHAPVLITPIVRMERRKTTRLKPYPIAPTAKDSRIVSRDPENGPELIAKGKRRSVDPAPFHTVTTRGFIRER
jgi:hypothetical protein